MDMDGGSFGSFDLIKKINKYIKKNGPIHMILMSLIKKDKLKLNFRNENLSLHLLWMQIFKLAKDDDRIHPPPKKTTWTQPTLKDVRKFYFDSSTI